MKVTVDTQKEWARWKYYVMARSQANYNELRQLFASNQWDSKKESRFYEILVESEKIVPTVGSLQNAYQHVWGYFKRRSSPAELAEYKVLLSQLTVAEDRLKPFLQELTLIYDVTYLRESYLLFPKE